MNIAEVESRRNGEIGENEKGSERWLWSVQQEFLIFRIFIQFENLKISVWILVMVAILRQHLIPFHPLRLRGIPFKYVFLLLLLLLLQKRTLANFPTPLPLPSSFSPCRETKTRELFSPVWDVFRKEKKNGIEKSESL